MYDVDDGAESFILEEDNFGPHRAKLIATYLANEEGTRMKFPPQSRDLNPNANMCGLMEMHLRKRALLP